MTRRAQASGNSHAAAALVVSFDDNRLLARLVGPHDQHLVAIEDRLGVAFVRRGNRIAVTGPAAAKDRAVMILRELYARLEQGGDVATADIQAELKFGLTGGRTPGSRGIKVRRGIIHPRTPNQALYIEALASRDMVFGLGPAGTGKTYLAVAVAVSMLIERRVRRIVLSRPALEAGERLGFLPGDLKEKVDPYLRPLYDALFDMLPGEQVSRWMEAGDIEIAPLAFMRGRTLAHALVILDEAQNCTPMQMRMALTRLGEASRMAVTGDPSQTDLPAGQMSGLSEAQNILRDVEGVSFVRFDAGDVVRHSLVTRIVRAYADHDAKSGKAPR